MTENRLARKDTGGRDCFACWLAMTENRLARNDGRCGNDDDGIKPNICFFNFEFVNFRFDLPAGKTGI